MPGKSFVSAVPAAAPAELATAFALDSGWLYIHVAASTVAEPSRKEGVM